MPLDPTPNTLSLYTTHMCHHIEPRSIDSYLSGICSELEPFFPTVCAAHSSLLVLRTIKPVVRKCALTCNDLNRAVASLGPSPSHDDHLFSAIILTGFHALLRLRELVWPNHLDNNGYEFLLPAHKTDIFFEGNHFRDRLFPLHAELWLQADGSIPTRSWSMWHLRQQIFHWDVAEHSMRAGSATSLTAAGLPAATIQTLGRATINLMYAYYGFALSMESLAT
ncbi:hypothetical protein C8Q70DRAFT_1048763 [Cubamyces menziesii]|nr:hypothetical protein C8Q70DRAFT_1048763 [Cubamyces menziesii]